VAAETILAPPEPPAAPEPPPPVVPPVAPPPTTAEPAPAPAPPPAPREPRTVALTTRRLVVLGIALAALLAAAVLGAVLLSGGDDDPAAGGGTTAPGTTQGSQPAAAGPETATAGLASLVPNTIFKDCEVDASPSPGAVESASCGPPADPAARTLPFYPDNWQVSIYPSAAQLNAAYNDLRSERDIGSDFGRCNAVTWGGEAEWLHGPQKPGGRQFCYFEGNVAVIVWTHGKLGQASHIDTLGVARAGGSDHASLFNWYRFWHHRIGKCPQTDCVAQLQ